jgi:hypothetical protein
VGFIKIKAMQGGAFADALTFLVGGVPILHLRTFYDGPIKETHCNK